MSANRIGSNDYPIDIISKLCHASIIYELLSVRHNKVVNIEFNKSNKDSELKNRYLCTILKRLKLIILLVINLI